MSLLRITTPTACGGLVIEGGLVTQAAPFLKEFLEEQPFAYPKRESLIRHVCEARGWTVETVQPHEKVDSAPRPLCARAGCPAFSKLALRLEEMLWPERFPPGHARHDPAHVFWDGCDDYGPDNDDWIEPYQWNADTIEWVAELVEKELGRSVEPEPEPSCRHTWEPTGRMLQIEGVDTPVSREFECRDCDATTWGRVAASDA